MAYDRDLADRIRAHLAHRAGVTEKELFGGIAFMLQGNMAVGVSGADLLVRLARAQHATAVVEPHARPFAMTGREMPGYILVAPPGTATDAALGTWIDRAVAHGATLPPKKKPAAKPKATAKAAKPKATAKAATSKRTVAAKPATPKARSRR